MSKSLHYNGTSAAIILYAMLEKIFYVFLTWYYCYNNTNLFSSRNRETIFQEKLSLLVVSSFVVKSLQIFDKF